MTGYGKHPGALRPLYWNLSLSTRYKLNFWQVYSQDKRACTFGTRGTYLFKLPSCVKHLVKYFTPLTKVAQIKIYPASHKLCLNRDRSTYANGEQEKLIGLSSFSMSTTLKA
jgi:hypothetical protein